MAMVSRGGDSGGHSIRGLRGRGMDLARRAGVSRARVFARFGSKLGVLEALSLRCAGGPEMRALRDAQGVEDPVAAVDALLDAGCDLWEKEGYMRFS
jgi:AcrR family transcriptional regulator